MRLFPAVLALVIGLLAGCAPGRDLAPLPEVTPSAYRLGVGDQVRIITFGEDQLTGTFRVNDSGLIDLPLLGAVKASGLTSSRLGSEIATELKQRKLFRDPSVSVEINEYRPIFVLGEVKTPGEYPYRPGMTVLTAVTVAGGFTYRAIEDYASVVRTSESDKAVEGLVNRQSFLMPGDVLTIYERRF